MLICIKQLSAQFIKKFSNTEVELKKVLVIKKTCMQIYLLDICIWKCFKQCEY